MHRCLLLCTESIRKAGCSGSRSEFDPDFELTITDSNDETIYAEKHADIHDTLAWMWREILVTTAARGIVTDAIESDLDRSRLEDDVYGFIRKDGGAHISQVLFESLL
jgi:hypothetical protein